MLPSIDVEVGWFHSVGTFSGWNVFSWIKKKKTEAWQLFIIILGNVNTV